MKNRRRQLLLALPVPLAVIAVDLIVRPAMLAKLTLDFKAYYLASALCLGFFWYAFLALANRLFTASQALGWAAVVTAAALFTATIQGSYTFLGYFGALPNLFVFEYVLDDPMDCWIYAKSALHPLQLATVLSATIALVAYLGYAARRPAVASGRIDLVINGMLALALALFLNNNVRMGPNAFTPEINTVFSLTRAIQEDITGNARIDVVGTAAREPVKPRFGSLPFNVLLVLGESMRAKSLSAYGYFRDTTPHLSAFFAAHPDQIIRYDHAYANATRTMLAFPSFFTGVVPSQANGLLHRLPSLFDYGRAFDNTQTFLISTQSLHWGNFDRFLDVGTLSYAWYKETSPYVDVDRDRFESVDDRYLPEAFGQFLAQRDRNKVIFGAIQLTNTHAPYKFDKESDLFHDERLTNLYDNAINYNDRQLWRVLSQLNEQGLLRNTLVIATSDHGEAFGEHGYYGHMNSFYDEEARVPLWIHLPDVLAKNQALVAQLRANAKEPVSNADIIPTTLSLITGRRYGELATFTDRMTGAPLDRALPADRAIVMQNFNDSEERVMFVGLGLVMGKYKYLLKFNQARGEEELYDLDVDPKEQNNLWATAPESLKATIHRHLSRYKNSKELLLKALPSRAG